MMIELAYIISGLSLAVSVYLGISGLRRGRRQDDQKDATNMATVIVKLESIQDGIAEIKVKMNTIEVETKELRDRLIAVEGSAKQAHRRIDTLEGKRGV